MGDKETIGLRELLKIVVKYKYPFISIILICTFIAFTISFFVQKKYESTVVVRAKGPKQAGISLQVAAAAVLGGGGGAVSITQTYIEMLKSRSVMKPVVEQLDIPNKENIDPKGFAQTNLKVQNIKGTDLLEITGVGKSPEEAENIATNTVNSFQQFLTQMNQSEQSLMMKFLKDRIVIAKQDMEKAEQQLEKFRQDQKIFEPEEQSKALIKKLTDYDQNLAKQQVGIATDQAKLQATNDQLSQQNAAISNYNIADNSVIQQIRESITQKQIALIEQQQKYTEKHPSVILLQKEIEELKLKLHEEVRQSVDSQATTLNPVHSALLKGKIETETEIIAGQAALDATKRIQSENEKEISGFSANSLTYIGLERQTKITQEVYGALVKNYEQTRIQEAMESMDIQIVDSAVLPKGSSWPNPILFTLIGAMVGIMITFFMLIVLYSRQSTF